MSKAIRHSCVVAALAALSALAAPGCGARTVPSRSEAEGAGGMKEVQERERGQAVVVAHGAVEPPDDAVIRWTESSDDAGRFMVQVVGLPDAELESLRQAKLSAGQWSEGFSVRVLTHGGSSGAQPAMLGSYEIGEGLVQFEPRFPLEPGLSYRATFDRSRLLPAGDSAAGGSKSENARVDRSPIVAEFTVPKLEAPATTVVTAVFPSGGRLPENQLKLYVHFSAPMSRGGAYRHLHLADSSGNVVDLPFLELDEELWDPIGTRFTVFFDPGRIKRGLKPREEEGPILEEGKSYSLVIDREWLDAKGNPLKESFRKTFDVGPPDDVQPNPKTWQVQPPRQPDREPLVITFPEPLDRGMLERVLAVVDAVGAEVEGEVQIEDAETRWVFTPAQAWSSGTYQLLVQSNLEDLAGNSIVKPFELDVLHPVRRAIDVDVVAIDFQIPPASTNR